jgi:hypothetical protein
MLHFRTLRSRFSSLGTSAQVRSQSQPVPQLLALVGGLTLATGLPVLAHSPQLPTPAVVSQVIKFPPEATPTDLKALLTQMDAAANSQNVPAMMKFYSDNFTHADGLTRSTLEQALTKLWQQYPKLTYRTELKSFEKTAKGYKFDTITYITGTQQLKSRTLKLAATLTARQQVEGEKIVQQETLAEQNTITSGENPPTLKVLLPEQVRVGQSYSFDAIVQEPLENDLLLGTAVAETVNPATFLNPPKAELSPLLSGGLFKTGRAPNSPTNQWLSAVVMRHSGVTIVTQRLRVVAQ